jgi:hypothetical protein
MELLLIVLLLLVVFGGGWGVHSGSITMASPIGIILLVAVLLLLFGGLGPRFGWYHY